MKTQSSILIAFILNLAFSVFELIGGMVTGSIAIISDAIHDMGDAVSLGVSVVMERKSAKKPDDDFTFGYTRYSVIGSAFTTLVLLFGSVTVIINAFGRILHPSPINYNSMIVFAVVGLAVNLLAAFFTRAGESLNQKAVNLHMLEDVLGWVVVLIGAVVMRFSDLAILDPIISICVAVFILIMALKTGKEILNVLLEKAPKHQNIQKVTTTLMEINGIRDVHHVHLWSMNGQDCYATMHIVAAGDTHQLKLQIREKLDHLGIHHATLELEQEGENCAEITCKTPPAHHHCHHHQHH